MAYLLGPTEAFRLENLDSGAVTYLLGEDTDSPSGKEKYECSDEPQYSLLALLEAIDPSKKMTIVFEDENHPFAKEIYREFEKADKSSLGILDERNLRYVKPEDKEYLRILLEIHSAEWELIRGLFGIYTGMSRMDPEEKMNPELETLITEFMGTVDRGERKARKRPAKDEIYSRLISILSSTDELVIIQKICHYILENDENGLLLYLRNSLMKKVLENLVRLYPYKFKYQEIVQREERKASGEAGAPGDCIKLKELIAPTFGEILKGKTERPIVPDEMYLTGPILYSEWIFEDEHPKHIHLFGEQHRGGHLSGYTCSAKNQISFSDYLEKWLHGYAGENRPIDVFTETPTVYGTFPDIFKSYRSILDPEMITKTVLSSDIEKSSVHIHHVDTREFSYFSSYSRLAGLMKNLKILKKEPESRSLEDIRKALPITDLEWLDVMGEKYKSILPFDFISTLKNTIESIHKPDIVRSGDETEREYKFRYKDFRFQSVAFKIILNLDITCSKCSRPKSIFDKSFIKEGAFCGYHRKPFPTEVENYISKFNAAIFPKNIDLILEHLQAVRNSKLTDLIGKRIDEFQNIPKLQGKKIISYFRKELWKQIHDNGVMTLLLESIINPGELFNEANNIEALFMDLEAMLQLFRTEDYRYPKFCIFYAGAVHIQNYERFFGEMGLKLLKRIVADETAGEFCLPLKKMGTDGILFTEDEFSEEDEETKLGYRKIRRKRAETSDDVEMRER